MLICNYKLCHFEEVHTLSQRLAHFFPEPEAVRAGIYELLINALEHGMLGIGYAHKTQLLKEKRWNDEINRRLTDPANKEKYVAIEMKRAPGYCAITITDHGRGFDWKTFLESPQRQDASMHGHGLSTARNVSGAELTFNDTGNQITFSVTQPQAHHVGIRA